MGVCMKIDQVHKANPHTKALRYKGKIQTNNESCYSAVGWTRFLCPRGSRILLDTKDVVQPTVSNHSRPGDDPYFHVSLRVEPMGVCMKIDQVFKSKPSHKAAKAQRKNTNK